MGREEVQCSVQGEGGEKEWQESLQSKKQVGGQATLPKCLKHTTVLTNLKEEHKKVHMNLHFSEARQGNKPEGPLFYFQGKKAAQAGCTVIPIPSLNPFLHFFSDQLVSKHPQIFYLFKIILFVLCTYMYVR